VEPVRVEWPVPGRAEPHVIVNAGRYRAVRLHGQGLFPDHVCPDLYRSDPSQFTGVDEGNSILPVGVTPLPLACLYHALMFTCCPDHGITLGNGVGEWFLTVDILAGLHGSDCLQAVPVVGGTDDDGIHIGVVHNPSPVLYNLWRPLSGDLFRVSSSFIKPFVIDVAQGDALHLWKFKEGLKV